MATTPMCLGSVVRHSALLKVCLRSFSIRAPQYAPRSGANLSKEKAAKEKAKKRRKKHTMYKQYDLKEAEQFSLCDAIRSVSKTSWTSALLTGPLDTFELSKWDDRLQYPSTNVISS